MQRWSVEVKCPVNGVIGDVLIRAKTEADAVKKAERFGYLVRRVVRWQA